MMTAELFLNKMEKENSRFDEILMHKMGYIPRNRKVRAVRERNEDYDKARKVLESQFKKNYDEKEENLERVRKGDEIWRGCHANIEYIESLIEGKATSGVCWTYKDFSASPKMTKYACNINILLTASLISGESINEKHSQLLTLDFAEENEVRLKYGEKILLKSIKIVANYYKSGGFLEGQVIEINKIVSTGETEARGDGWMLKTKEEIKKLN